MKSLVALAMLATAPVLFAADTNSPASTLPPQQPPALQVNLTEQADLVRQIGEEAARGFDPEAHARWLREQIEALTPKPGLNAGGRATTAITPDMPTTVVTGATSPMPGSKAQPELEDQSATARAEVVLRETITKLRAMANQLEGQVEQPK